MQERFNETEAKLTANVFSYFLQNVNKKKELLLGSNKHLVMLTALAYFKECSNTKLKKLFPILNVQDTLGLLVEKDLIKVEQGENARVRYYKCTDNTYKLSANETYTKNALYVFANCLMNMDIYIKQNNIKSWNLLALMLEASLKVAYTTPYVDLGRDAILSIPGAQANRLGCRKNLAEMGVIKPRIAKSSANAGQFLLNKNAFIIERK